MKFSTETNGEEVTVALINSDEIYWTRDAKLRDAMKMAFYHGLSVKLLYIEGSYQILQIVLKKVK